MTRARATRWRLIILPNDGRAARSVKLGTGKLLLVVALAVAVVTTVLWLGWEVGARSARLETGAPLRSGARAQGDQLPSGQPHAAVHVSPPGRQQASRQTTAHS